MEYDTQYITRRQCLTIIYANCWLPSENIGQQHVIYQRLSLGSRNKTLCYCLHLFWGIFHNSILIQNNVCAQYSDLFLFFLETRRCFQQLSARRGDFRAVLLPLLLFYAYHFQVLINLIRITQVLLLQQMWVKDPMLPYHCLIWRLVSHIPIYRP